MAITISGVTLGNITGGPSSIRLSDLADVSIASPQNNQYLQYNSSLGEWQNAFINNDVFNYLNSSLTGSDGVVVTPTAGPNTVAISLANITPDSVSTTGQITANNIVINAADTTSGLRFEKGANITGPFSGVLAERSKFVTTDTNDRTVLTLIANGTTTRGSGLFVFQNGDPLNSSIATLTVSPVRTILSSYQVGTGVTVPLVLGVDNNPAITIDVNNDVEISGDAAVVGNITAANLSGTNTGDQTITLTGDVTGSGTGSFATTLATVNSNVGTFGGVTAVPVITVNAKGLITSMSTATISATAPSLTTARTIAATGDAAWSVSFDGSTNVSSALTLATVNSNVGTFAVHTVNAKGLTTAATNLSGDITSSGAVATLATVNSNTGTFSAVTVNGKGLVTAATNLAASGDATGTASGSGIALTLATVNGSPQANTFRKVTVNGKGLVTATSAVVASDITTALAYTPVNRAGDTMTGALVLNADPIAALGAATKQYVDNVAAGLNAHAAVATATTATLASSSGGTITYNNGTAGVGATLTTTGTFNSIGGYTLANTDRVLVKNEATLAHNGIYVRTSATVLTRAADFDNSPDAEVIAGDFAYVQNGTLVGTQWVLTTAGSIVIGTTGLVFSQLSGSGTIVGGTGISVSSNVVTNTGVTSAIAGTNIAVSAATGAVTFSVTGSVPLATSLSNGAAGNIVYQSAAGTTSYLATGTSSQVLVSGTTPSWTNTPTLTGTNFTAIPNAALTNSSVTVGSTNIALGATSTTLAGLTSVTSTTFVGALTGNASTATSAATLTTARTINGTSFNGSANITTANWGTARTLTIGTTGKSVNGSADVSWSLAEIGAAAANASVTIGSTNIALGATSTTLAGLTSVTSTSFVGDLTGNASTATNSTQLGGIAASGYAQIGTLTPTGNYLAVIRSSTSPALYIRQANTGPIARFFRNATAGTDSGTDQFEILNNGGATASSAITAPTFIGALSGNATTATTATTATNATNSAITDDTTTNANEFVVWSANSSGNNGLRVTSTKLLFNPSTGVLSSTAFNATSTARVKSAIVDLGTSYLSKFSMLKPREYDRKDYKAHEFGFIAEEMAEVYPEVVGRDNDGKPSGIDYGKLSTILTAKVQEQQTVIDTLKVQMAQVMELLKGVK